MPALSTQPVIKPATSDATVHAVLSTLNIFSFSGLVSALEVMQDCIVGGRHQDGPLRCRP